MRKSKPEVTKKTAATAAKGPNETPRVPDIGDKMYRRTLPDGSDRID